MRAREANLLHRAAHTLEASESIAANDDRDSDTLMLHFFGQPRAAVNVPIEHSPDGVYVRVDPTTDQVVGVQIEGFVVEFIQRHPNLADLLEVADLRGIDRAEALAIAARAGERRVPADMVHWLAFMTAD